MYDDSPEPKGEVDKISDEAVDEFETYLWVGQETRRPLKFSYYLLMDFEGEQDSELSGVGEFKSEIEFSNYDKPIDIQLLEELDG